MRIVQLTAENVKRLRAVQITPDRNVVVVGGRNGQGKSSVLDCIEMALGGVDKKKTPEPVRRGAKEGHILLELEGGMTIERTFVGDKPELIVRSDGARLGTPQRILDELVGQIGFDPLVFVRMKASDQVATLRSVIGLDFTEVDKKRAQAYDQRTEVGRDLKRAQGARDQHGVVEEAPDERVDVSAIRASLGTLQAENKARAEKEHRLEALRMNGTRLKDDIARLQREYDEVIATGKVLYAEIKTMPVHNVNAQLEQIAQADTINRKVDRRDTARKLDFEIETLANEAMQLTSIINDAEAEKRTKIAGAKLPIDGLGFDDGGVTLNGLPLEQASSAEKIRVGVAIGLALNPKLRVVLIYDGSLLDQESLAEVARMAHERDAQVWIEAVSADASVIIEDGAVLETVDTRPPADPDNTVRGKRVSPKVAKEEPGSAG